MDEDYEALHEKIAGMIEDDIQLATYTIVGIQTIQWDSLRTHVVISNNQSLLYSTDPDTGKTERLR